MVGPADPRRPRRPRLRPSRARRGAPRRGRRACARHRPRGRRAPRSLPLPAIRAGDLSRQGQGRGASPASVEGRRDRARRHRLRAVARCSSATSRRPGGAKVIDRTGLILEIFGQRAPHRARARCRSSWRICTTRRSAWCAPGPTSSASAAASASSAAPARPRSRPTAALIAGAHRPAQARARSR